MLKHRPYRTLGIAALMSVSLALPVLGENGPLTALSAAKVRLTEANADLETLLEYAEALRDLSQDDPAAALAARTSFSQCHSSPLRAYCTLLPGLFKPESKQ